MKRPRHSLPDDIAFALKKRWLTSAYEERPDYQRNDYVGWVNRAKLDATREQRTGRMLDGLAEGGVHMGIGPQAGRRRGQGVSIPSASAVRGKGGSF